MTSDSAPSPEAGTAPPSGLGRQGREGGLGAHHLHLGPFFPYSRASAQALPIDIELVIE